MREAAVFSRRAIGAALPLAALAGALPLAAAVSLASPAAVEVDAAAHRCRAAHKALDDALNAYERALPAPHFTLDMTGRRPRPFGAIVERRLFDGKAPARGVDVLGNPDHRYVATVETVEQDLRRYDGIDRQRQRLLYRMRRRARSRAAKVEMLEASFGLAALEAEVDMSERALEELAREVFREPATSMAAVLVQARTLSTYAATIEAGHAAPQAGKFGRVLADGLQHVARAA